MSSSPVGARRRDVLVFDLDGTLVDSAPDIGGALNAVLAEEGRAALPLADVRSIVGDGVRVLVERAWACSGAAVDPAAVPELVTRFERHYAAGGHAATHPFPGVLETLDALAAGGFRLAICTNKPMVLTRQLLDVLGLAGAFAAVTGGDSLPVKKPHPDHLLGTLALLGAGPDRAVMVGDSANDVNAARAAGMPSAVVPWGYTRVPPAELGADLLLGEFADLLPWMASGA